MVSKKVYGYAYGSKQGDLGGGKESFWRLQEGAGHSEQLTKML